MRKTIQQSDGTFKSGEKTRSIMTIFKILQDHSLAERKLTHTDIEHILRDEYNIKLARKAIGQKLDDLRALGFNIISDHDGSYYEQNAVFNTDELHYLCDSILSNKQIPACVVFSMMEKLGDYVKVSDLSVIEKKMKQYKNTSRKEATVITTMEEINDAIDNDCKIEFSYCRYEFNSDKNKVMLQEVNCGKHHVVSPYKLIYVNNKYYLFANDDDKGISFFKLDRIMGIKILKELRKELNTIEGYENIDYSKYSKYPFPFTDNNIDIKLLIKKGCESVIDQMVDWFGCNNFKVNELYNSDKYAYRVKLNSSELAMAYWCTLYSDRIIVEYPRSLKDKVTANFQIAIDNYEIKADNKQSKKE